MPAFLPDAPAEPDAYDEAMTLAPSSDALAMGQIFRDAQLSSKRPLAAMFAADAEKFDRDMERMTGASDKLDPAEVKARFGVDVGHPVTEATAGYLARQARDRAFRDDVLGRADLNPLQTLGAGLAGGLVDPAGLPLLFAPELLGVRSAIEGSLAARSAASAGEAVVKTGRLANIGRGALATGGEGLVGGALFEAPNYGLRRYSGEDDYTLGDSLANVLGAGLFGAGLGALGGALHPTRAPRAIEGLREESRLGAAALALDAAAEDRPVRVGGLAEAEQARARPTSEALSALDETPGDATLRARLLDETTAVTTRGTEIPARYALVELKDLVTSHDDDLARNPAFPPELQPRSRERAGAQARNHALEAELNPKRLMRETGAESGAPIVSPDGVVESGNGRTIALRRSAARDGEAYGRYRAELAAQGFDTAGMEQPVLVRLRTQALTGERRAGLAREMNADVTERMGAAEQAMADAAQLDAGVLSALDIEGVAGERAFARRFIARVAPDAQNTLIAADGALSKMGAERVKAALMAHAYGDPRLVEALFEAADPNIKTIGQALSEASPEWAALRAAVARGDTPAELDLTGALRAAVDLVRWARDARRPVGEVIAERLGQTEMFGGEAIGAETEAFLRLFYRDEAFRRPRAADSIAAALKDYSRQAQAVTPGPDLFGGTPDAATARDILDTLAGRYAASAEAGAAEPAGFDFRAAGDDVERPRPEGLRPEGGGGPGGQGGKPEARVEGGEPHTVTLYRGEKGAAAEGDTFYTPERAIAEQYAGKDGDVVEKKIAFRNLLTADTWFAAKQILGLRQSSNMPELIAAAREAGYDGITFKTSTNGQEYIHIPGGADRAPAGRGRAEAIIAADPELKALHDDTEALIVANGLDLPKGAGSADPDLMAEAIRAAALCLSGAFE